ncbi:ankyrin repeat-containing domain protein [Hyaloscypha sp. PMI_1271]|nr:ankyrin repeat-containing domain protein [Hyaloscypha sp. PMI_1271]
MTSSNIKSEMLANVYASEMTHHSFGHACYHHTSSKDVQPGVVGYFDLRGEWNTILHLKDLQPSARKPVRGIAAKFSCLEDDLERAPDAEMKWGPRTSKHVKKQGAELKIDVPIPTQIPAKASVDGSYHLNTDFGAVLITHGPVIRSKINRERIFEDWAKKNEEVFLKYRKEVQKHGVWIVTSTYSTKKLSLNVWQGREKTVKLSFSVGVQGIANLEPSIEFEEGSHDDGWTHYEGKAKNEKMVCFVGGIRFKYKRHFFTQDTLDDGVAYARDPRRWESFSWSEYERFGIDAEPPSEKENVEEATVGDHENGLEFDVEATSRIQEDEDGLEKEENREDLEKNEGETSRTNTPEEDISMSVALSSPAERSSTPEAAAEEEEELDEDKKKYSSKLQAASAEGRIQAVEELLKAGENVNEESGPYSGTALQAASAGGYEDIVEILLEAGADVNAMRHYGYTALVAASQNGHNRIIQLLLNAGADPNISTTSGGNALYVAAHGGHDQAVMWLLAGGANVNRVELSTRSALQAACAGGYVKCVRWLLAAGADVDVDGGCSISETALYQAAEGGHLRVIQQLVTAGADINLQGGYLGNPLQAASAAGHHRVVEFLLMKGADIDATGGDLANAISAASYAGHKQVVEILLAEMDKKGEKKFGPALRYAVSRAHKEIVQLLLAAGADVNGGDYKPPLIEASGEGHEQLVQLLLASGADVNATYTNFETITALYIASENGHKKVVKTLLNAGANVDAKAGYRGNTLLMAAFSGRYQVIPLLLDAGANIEAHDAVDKCTALQVASSRGHIDVIEVLLAAQKKADVDAQGGFYGTALQAAAADGHTEIIQRLLGAGATVNVPCGHYGSALQAAAANGHKEIVEKLLDLGADPTSQEGEYGNALQAAAVHKHVDVVGLFVERGVMGEEQIEEAKKTVEERLEEVKGRYQMREEIERYERILEMLTKGSVDSVESQDSLAVE